MAAGSSTRTFELVGAFLLGGGMVAVGYELGRGSAGSQPAQAAATAGPDDVPDGAGDGDDPSAVAQAPVYSGDDEAQGGAAAPSDRPPHLVANDAGSYSAYPPMFSAPRQMDAEAQAKFPRHGMVTSLAAIVRRRPELDAPILGILRGGTRIRVDAERTFGGRCKQGWNAVFPHGWVCRKAGLSVHDTPPQDLAASIPVPRLDDPLPYEYWRVNDPVTPFFHRLPSFEEQDRADAAGAAWAAAHGRDPMPTHPQQRPDDVPAVVKEFMNAGYYVTKAGEEVKSKRRFLRTTRGAYGRKYQLSNKEPPSFRGRVLASKDDLPMHFVRRELPLMKREAEGSDVLVKTETIPERLSVYKFTRKIHIGAKVYFEDEQGLLMRAYAVGEAYKLKRPPGVEASERWIHIDLSEQVLVAYAGDEPQFATLVSTGKQQGMTPVGVHRVQIKHIATSMRDQPREEEAYSIDDVPWTQYFSGSVALHGAFWHAGFGLVRSHGCVNLSPSDARWLFGFTDPPLPDTWHAIAPGRGVAGGVEGSPVVVTE